MDGGAKALITLRRDSAKDIRDRRVSLLLDGTRIGELRYGGAVRQEIEPGRHQLKLNNTLIRKTVEFEAAPDEHVEFVVINYVSPVFWFLALALGVAPLFLKVERVNQGQRRSEVPELQAASSPTEDLTFVTVKHRGRKPLSI